MNGTFHIVVAMKPGWGTFAENAIIHEVTGLNIDAARIATGETLKAGAGGLLSNVRDNKEYPDDSGYKQNDGGRWPANVILGHKSKCRVPRCEPDCPVRLLGQQSGELKAGTWNRTDGARPFNNDGEATDAHEWKKCDDSGTAARYYKQISGFEEPSKGRTI